MPEISREVWRVNLHQSSVLTHADVQRNRRNSTKRPRPTTQKLLDEPTCVTRSGSRRVWTSVRPSTFLADNPPLISEIPFATFAASIGPFTLWLATSLALGMGLVHATRADALWAKHVALSVHPDLPLLTDTTVITLQRSLCFGVCPDYTLTVWGSGRVEFEGRAHVCAPAKQTAAADPLEVSRLVRAMVATGYPGYSWEQGSLATDNPTVTTSLKHEGVRYEIEHYHGDSGAPRWLRAMEDEIDRVAGTQRWLPFRGPGGSALCRTPEGGTRSLFDVPAVNP
jgi:hypothetical protein